MSIWCGNSFLEWWIKGKHIYSARGFEVKGWKDNVHKSNKSLYGFKQSSKLLDDCVYIWRSQDSLIILLLYVDDISLACNNVHVIERTIYKKILKWKTWGLTLYELWTWITRDRISGLSYLDQQENYLNDILQRYQMSRCNYTHK